MMSPWFVRAPALVVLAVFAIVAALDLWFELTNQPPVGSYVHRWARKYPWFAAVTALLAGAAVGHLFWPA